MIREGKRKIIIPFRPLLKWLVRLRRSPRAIAGGFALGTFIALTPTIGVQLIIVVFLATLMNLNRPAAMASVWITNVATVAPIYTFNYWVGSLMFSGPSVGEVYKTFSELTAVLVGMDFWDIWRQFGVVLDLGQEIIIPLIIGSIIVGLICAVITYIVSMILLRWLLMRRHKRRILN